MRRAPGARVLVGLALGLAACAAEGPVERVVAPPFALPDLGGREVKLVDFAGRIVVIDFWATWCAPCVQQIPVLNAFHREQAADGAVVLGVAVDAGGEEDVAPFAAEQGIAYPVLLGSEALARDYGAPGFPALAVVDGAGRIASFHLGVITPAELAEAVAQAR